MDGSRLLVRKKKQKKKISNKTSSIPSPRPSKCRSMVLPQRREISEKLSEKKKKQKKKFFFYEQTSAPSGKVGSLLCAWLTSSTTLGFSWLPEFSQPPLSSPPVQSHKPHLLLFSSFLSSSPSYCCLHFKTRCFFYFFFFFFYC
jgi:hypothetical protein